MANSGSFSTGSTGYGYPSPNKLTFTWSLTSQSTTNNTSKIHYRVYADGGASDNWQMLYNASVNVDGATQSGSGIQAWQGQTIFEGDKTITHNSDGSKSFSASAAGGFYYSSGSASGSGSWNLPTIARASTPSINTSPNNSPDVNIGDTMTIYTNRKSSAFTHTVVLNFGNYAYTIGTNVATSIQLDTSTIASNLYQQIPNAAVGVGQIVLTTYNGSTNIGTKTCELKLYVVDSNPTFNQAYQDTNSTTTAITGNNQQIIQNNSTLQVKITNAQAKNYATLASSKVVINDVTYNGTFSGSSSTINVGALNLSSNIAAKVTVTDSRGISTTSDLPLTILPWANPTAVISLARQNNFYAETNINVNADYASLDNKNTITIKARYKKTTDSSYSAYVTLQDAVTSTLTLDNNYAWDVQVLLTDKIGSTTYNLSLTRGLPMVFFDTKRNSTSFNGFPQNDDSVEVTGDLYVNGENILGRILGYGQIAQVVTGDWNTACGTRSGFYMGNNLSHRPTGSTVDGWWIVVHMAHNASYQRQIAYSFLEANIMFTRIQNNGTWSAWVPLDSSASRSASELMVGQDTDGAPVYKKTVKINSLPNAGQSSYPHGISNIDKLVKFEAFARNPSGTLYALPHLNLGNVASGIYITVGKANIIIDTGEIDRSSYNGEVTIYYTKTQPESE